MSKIMPLYEGISLIQEKQAVVLDIGESYTKFGFTGEPAPRCVIPTAYICPKTKQVIKLVDQNTSEDVYDFFVQFIHILYFRHVLVSPKDRKVVIVENLFTPTMIKQSLAKVLFCHYEVSSIMWLLNSMGVATTLGLSGNLPYNHNINDCALVIDFGANEIRAVPVLHGRPQPTAATDMQLDFNRRLRELLLDDNPGIDQALLTDRLLEDVKIRSCFVTTLERSLQRWVGEKTLDPAKDVTFRAVRPLLVSGNTRETAAEIMFPRQELDNLTLPCIILDTVLKCPIDTRLKVCSGLVLCGGNATLVGLKSRLLAELRLISASPPYREKLFKPQFQFHKLPAKENYAGWLGGAILGSTDAMLSRGISREQFARTRRAPDWTCLLDNTPANHYQYTISDSIGL